MIYTREELIHELKKVLEDNLSLYWQEANDEYEVKQCCKKIADLIATLNDDDDPEEFLIP